MARPKRDVWGKFNDASCSRWDRDKRAIQRFIDAESESGHWLWTGRVNMWGTPVRDVGGRVVSAVDVVYSIWKRCERPPTTVRTCEHPLCVRPGCWKTPPRRPRTARSVAVPTGRKDSCARGHDLSVHRRRSDSGWTYCAACEPIKAQMRREKRAAARALDSAEETE